MTDGGSGNRLTKNQRREAAREKAKQLREEQKKRERRNRILIQGGIAVGILAVLAIIAVIIVSSIRPPAPGPKNMASDGILLGEGLKVVPSGALEPGQSPIPSTPDPTGNVANIVMYVDYLCPYCHQFETTNDEQIASMVRKGAATVEIHPVPMLAAYSQGTKYSLRATNAAACVANYSPDDFWAFHNLLIENQPEEGTPGLTDDEIKDLARKAGVSKASSIESCIDDGRFKSWAQAALDRFLAQDIPYLDKKLDKLGTPLVIVNGKKYNGSLTDADEFRKFVQDAAAGTYATSSPAPSISPSPSASPAS